MAKSRQAVFLRRKSFTTLRAAAAGTPMAIEDDGTAWIVRDRTTGQELFRTGRFQVVSAYIDGFVAAFDGSYERARAASEHILRYTPPSERATVRAALALLMQRYQAST